MEAKNSSAHLSERLARWCHNVAGVSNIYAMKNLVKLYYEREIQLFVLLSFALQVFLFFTGSLRRRSTNIFLIFSIWTAYLGADWVAVYALGNLSGVHEDISRSEPLSFFWAPFLLIHLGGQDTITAFAMEDNNLWLRHFLNLVVQVVLAVYVFSKSARRQSAELIVSGVFVFIAGVIKYGERTWSLKCGSSKSLESSTGNHYKQRFPEGPELKDSDCDYRKTVSNALYSMFNVVNVFAARNLFGYSSPGIISSDDTQDAKRMFKVVELELAMMYDDLYTKALVLRTMRGMILRCISHTCSLVAFALFLTCDKGRYNGADVAITYSLFVGGFFLDLSAMFIFIMSPWTWVWLKAQKCDLLASLSWFLFSSDIGWPEKRPLWSNSIGQYSLLSREDSGRDRPTRSCNQKVMALARRSARLVGVEKKKMFWMSKLLGTKYLKVDEKMMVFVVEGINRIRGEFFDVARAWPKLGPFLETIRVYFAADFGAAIVVIHSFTEEYLNAAAAARRERGGEANDMMEVCRKLSNYIMYLFVHHPSMLPLNASSEATLAEAALLTVRGRALEEMLEPCEQTLREMVDMWTRLLIYSAGKSQGPMHAAELAYGGELITFVWLLMVKAGLGDSEAKRILIANSVGVGTNLKEAYAFYFAS